MFNHFASLLANLNLAYTAPTQESYLLADELSDILATTAGEFIALNDYYTVISRSKIISILINKDYEPLTLPNELQQFYNILFPASASTYYKQFLLYCYLRVIAATDRKNDVKKHDSRITYTLDDIKDYFRFTNISLPRSSDPNYNILVFGSLLPQEDAKYFLNSIIINQLSNTQKIQIFSSTQLQYYKASSPPSNSPAGMDISFNVANNISEAIPVGDTGLYIRISGTFDSLDPSKTFQASGNKLWTFTAQAPFNFNFTKRLEELQAQHTVVDNMLAYCNNRCDTNYERLWTSHYNDLYRFAGLLLAYVERMNILWLSQT